MIFTNEEDSDGIHNYNILYTSNEYPKMIIAPNQAFTQEEAESEVRTLNRQSVEAVYKVAVKNFDGNWIPLEVEEESEKESEKESEEKTLLGQAIEWLFKPLW